MFYWTVFIYNCLCWFNKNKLQLFYISISWLIWLCVVGGVMFQCLCCTEQYYWKSQVGKRQRKSAKLISNVSGKISLTLLEYWCLLSSLSRYWLDWTSRRSLTTLSMIHSPQVVELQTLPITPQITACPSNTQSVKLHFVSEPYPSTTRAWICKNKSKHCLAI